jgi:glyoxylase-like metal-dependent hydrolase (beta-lactamase superfamily II)
VAPEPIDLRHQASDRVIGVYLLETDDGPALFDSGPTTCIPALEAGLARRGLALRDIRHLLLSHIHLDHAGAAGTLVREHPELHVHVSEVGAPHLVDPSRLEASARRLYGDAFDGLWGELAPVPEANIRVVGESVVGLECFPTPGHASHHVSYLSADGTLYAGDAAGVRIVPGRYVIPVSPPPEFDPEIWSRTIDEIEQRRPERLALIHFGVAEDVEQHLAMLREELARWVERVERGATEEEFVDAAREDIEATVAEDPETWQRAAPLWQSYRGIERYWRKRREAERATQPR